jgi:hypothetical protein
MLARHRPIEIFQMSDQSIGVEEEARIAAGRELLLISFHFRTVVAERNGARRAVGDALGVGAQALRETGSPRIVDAGGADVISTGTALLMRMAAWKTRPREREPS